MYFSSVPIQFHCAECTGPHHNAVIQVKCTEQQCESKVMEKKAGKKREKTGRVLCSRMPQLCRTSRSWTLKLPALSVNDLTDRKALHSRRSTLLYEPKIDVT